MNAPVYPAYKPSGIEWLGDVPEHWEVRRLKFAATCNDETLSEDTDPETEIVYVDISSVSLDGGITSTESLTFEKAPSRARRKVHDGDTIVSTVRTYLKAIAPINNPPENLVVSTGFAVIRPLDVMEPTFLGYFLQSQGFVDSVVANSKGVSYPAINPSELVCIPVSYPKDRSEQRAIAAFLDRKTGKIDELIEKKKELIKKLAEHRTALITAAVTGKLPEARGRRTEDRGRRSEAGGQRSEVSMKDSGIAWIGLIPEHWDVRKLKFVVERVQTGTTPSSTMDEYYDEPDMLWFTPVDFGNNGLVLTDSKRKLYHTALENGVVKLIPKGSIMIVGIGATLGKVAQAGKEGTSNQQINAIVPASMIHPSFFLFFLSVMQEIMKVLSNATTLGIMNQDKTKQIPITLPKLCEQKSITNYLDEKTGKIDGLIKKTETAIKTLEEYRTALITAAVTGKVKVTGAGILHYEPAASSHLLAAEKKRGYGNEDTGEIGRAVLNKSPR